jgi:hypothetical protein
MKEGSQIMKRIVSQEDFRSHYGTTCLAAEGTDFANVPSMIYE